MADKRAQLAKKKRAKQKKKRQAASVARAARTPKVPTGAPRRASVADAAGWPMGEGYLSSTWHEQGAQVHGCFVREHASGRVAAVFFHADLENGGVTDVLSHGDVHPDAVHGEMARRSELSGEAMLTTDGHLVAKVFHTARALGGPPPDDLDTLLTFFGDVDGSEASFEVLTGTPPPPPEKRKSLLGWLFG